MSNKAMKKRHWDRIADTTTHPFDIENDDFKLRNIMEAPLLKFKEDIEVNIKKINYLKIAYNCINKTF